MGQYHTSLRLNRRRRLVADDRPEIARVTALGVFIILIAFFVGLVAWTAPNETKTVDLLSTLQSTFRPLDEAPQLQAPPAVPGWIADESTGTPSPLAEAQKLFPDAFPDKPSNNAGALEMRFTPDRFQALLLGQPELAENLLKGFKTPRAARQSDDEYVLQVTIGAKGRTVNAARALLEKTRKEMNDLGVHPTRLLIGFEAGGTNITLRITPSSQFRGVL